MRFFKKLFNKRQQPKNSDDFQVIFKTSENLSEKQQNDIFTIIKEGTISGEDPHDITILIIMCTGFPVVGLRYISKNVVEVMI